MSAPVTHWPEGYQPPRSPVYAFNELTLAAPLAQVWAWLVRAAWWPHWYANCRHLRFEATAGPDLVPGCSFAWTTFGVRVRTTVEVWEPERQLAWRGTGTGGVGYHVWHLEARGAGCHVITEETQHGVVPSLGRWLLGPGLRFWHQRWLEGLGRVAQRGFPQGEPWREPRGA